MWTVIGIAAIVLSLVVTILLNRNWILRERSISINKDDVVLFLVTLLGSLGREVYNMLINGAAFNWVSLGISVIVSPIVFAAVHKPTKNVKIDLVRLCLAFQNGFFWNAIFEGVQPVAVT